MLAKATILLMGAALSASAFAADAPRSAAVHPSAVLNARPANTCFGGLDDGKHLLDESELNDVRKHTTASGCAAAGGRPGWRPRFNPPVRRQLLS